MDIDDYFMCLATNTIHKHVVAPDDRVHVKILSEDITIIDSSSAYHVFLYGVLHFKVTKGTNDVVICYHCNDQELCMKALRFIGVDELSLDSKVFDTEIIGLDACILYEYDTRKLRFEYIDGHHDISSMVDVDCTVCFDQ